LRDRIRSAGHRFVCARVAAIDAAAGLLDLEGGRRLHFDFCIVAVGGVNNTFGIPGADRHAMPFKSVDDCTAIHRRLAELASASASFSVVVVGGGLEGIEALGEVLRRFRDHSGIRIDLVEAGQRLLAEGPPAVDAAIRQHIETMPVSLHTSERVAKVTPRSVVLSSRRRLRSDLTIWTGGARPPELLFESGLAESRQIWAPVHPSLFSLAFDNVLVAGDAAELSSPLPKQAYHAIDMGQCAASNLMRFVNGQLPSSFRPSPKPMLLAFGDIDTFLVAGSKVVASPLLAAAKEAVFQGSMAGLDPLRNRRAIGRLQQRAGQGLARLLPAGGNAWSDLARMFSVRIDAS
jgi:NADH dehydrogenase